MDVELIRPAVEADHPAQLVGDHGGGLELRRLCLQAALEGDAVVLVHLLDPAAAQLGLGGALPGVVPEQVFAVGGALQPAAGASAFARIERGAGAVELPGPAVTMLLR